MEKKRESVRAIITLEKENKVKLVTIFRRKKKENENGETYFKEYYTIPGGGVEENDTTLENALKRELREELNVEITNIKKCFNIETEDRIEHFFTADYVSGNFEIVGEEKDRMSEDNFYEPRLLSIKDLEKYDVQKEVKEYFEEK